ncbi:MAG: hypothetical protein WCE83_02320 [Candidatus Baltobacteraceae bacterium]
MHIDEAHAFSAEVGNADNIVKKAFFSLSGSARTYLLDRYESLYGASARAYAQQTIPKWHSGSVQMSGMVAQRLFDLMPPFMPIAQKHQVFEMVWKQYGPRSSKFLYFGPDSDPEAVLSEVDKYFDGLNVQYKIPSHLERRFDWLSDNDVALKQQLLNHFMNEQRKAAVASARLNLEMMLARMKSPDFGQISRLSHTLLVGNHQLEMRADPLRSGYIFSDSGRDAIKPKPQFQWGSCLFVVVIGLLFGTWVLGGASHGFPNQQASSTVQEDGQPRGTPVTTETWPVDQARSVASSNVAQTSGSYEPSRTSGGPPPAAAIVARAAAQPASTKVPVPAAATASAAKSVVSAPEAGCSDTAITSMEDDGATVKLANGTAYSISDGGIMRIQVGQWSTGDSVEVCLSKANDGITYASISNPAHYQKVQAILTTAGATSRVDCADVKVVRMYNDGGTIDTSDGLTMAVSSAGIMRIQAGQWSTGDAVNVCSSTLANGNVAASIENQSHYQKVQATVVGQTRSSDVQCRSASISSVGDGGTSVRSSDGRSYSVSSAGIMRIQAQQWTTGERVQICEALARDGSTAASIENPAHFQKVQASRL